MTLVFAFRHTIAEEILKHLKLPGNVDKILLDSSVEAVDHFIATTNFSQYQHILGLGMYSGRDQDKIRIETECISQFRNNKQNLEILPIPYFIEPSEHMKSAKGMGNSWCNLVSYKLLKRVPDVKYTFLHVPKRFDVRVATYAIQGIMDEI